VSCSGIAKKEDSTFNLKVVVRVNKKAVNQINQFVRQSLKITVWKILLSIVNIVNLIQDLTLYKIL
jgi:hypothetical protein